MSDYDPSTAAYRFSSSEGLGPLPTSSAQVSDLIQRVARSDRSAFTQLYRATAPKLLGTILRILQHRSSAEEVLQDVYIRIWQKADQFDPARASPITWLVTIARNRAIDRVRSRLPGAREGDDELSLLATSEPDGPSSLEARQTLDHLNRCLEQLERDQQNMVRLAYLNGWSREELSAHFEKPVNTVKTWLRRALKQLKGCLTS